jgi:hypothetical protein
LGGTAGANQPQDSGLVNMADQFQGLPMSDLIGGPLKAACDAEIMLANATATFIEAVGFQQDPANKSGKIVRNAEFQYTRYAPSPDVSKSELVAEKMKLEVPLLAIVRIPTLFIDTVDVTFDMEVRSATSSKQDVNAQASMEAKASIGWGIFSATVDIKGSVSSSSSNTRSSDNSAKYHVEVHAKDSGMPEGLARVLDLLQQAITPQKVA